MNTKTINLNDYQYFATFAKSSCDICHDKNTRGEVYHQNGITTYICNKCLIEIYDRA